MTGTAAAQDYRGKVQGTVTDPSQAAVAGADVTLKNVNTGVEETRKSDGTGHYQFDFVQPGTYTLGVQAAGFQKFVQESFQVLTRGDVTVNAALGVGGVSETVSVTTEVNSVEFNTSTMTTTVQGQMLKDIPVLARNPFTLALLNPAVVNQYSDVAHRNPFYQWSNGGMDIGGPTGGKNDQELDGTSLNISARGSYNAPMDAVQEVAVQQNATDAEFGFSAGGTLNLSMKSGTNDIHGSAYYFGRNPKLNALANRISRDPQLTRQHIGGGSIGHPIIKNKLFNFFSFEKWKNTQPSSTRRTMPTELEKQGDFSQSYLPTALGTQKVVRPIYDPLTTVTNGDDVQRQPFPGNKIPQDRIDKTSAALMKDLWAPNNPGDDNSGTYNFKKSYGWWMKYWNFSDRVDYNLNDKWRVFGRFSKYQTRLDNPNWGGTAAVPSDNGGIMDALNAAGDVLWMASPRTTVNFRLGVSYVEDAYASEWAQVSTDVWKNLWPNSNWYQTVLNKSQGIYYPRFTFQSAGTDYNTTGIGGWWLVQGRSYNPTINVTHDMGMHHLKAGWQLRYSYDQNNAGSGPGSMYFNSIDTGSTYRSSGYNAAQSGNMYASGLLGVLDQDASDRGGFAQINPNLDMHQQQWGLYVQDDIKLTRNITLNLGLRWERETAPLEETRQLVRTFDPTLANGLSPVEMPDSVKDIAREWKIAYSYTGGLIYTSDKNKRMYDAPWSNFLPRAGIALRINDQTAFRAGYARYGIQWVTIHPETGGLPTYGFSRSTNVLGPLAGLPRAYASDPFPANNPIKKPVGSSLGAGTMLGDTIEYWDTSFMKTPMNDRFNFTLQRQAPYNFFTEATFFMSFAHNIQDPGMWGGNWNNNINQVNPNLYYKYKGAMDEPIANPFYNNPNIPGSLARQETVAMSALLKQYPQYGDIRQLGYSGRSDHYYSLQLKIERPITNGLMLLAAYNYGTEALQDYYDDVARYSHSLQWFDRGQPRHNLRLAGTWELPIGRGKKIGTNMNRILDGAIGGWATSHMVMWRTGNLTQFGNYMLNGDPTQNVPEDAYFNGSVFAQALAYTPRSNPRYFDKIRGPNFWQLDSTIVKYFKVTERVKFELRMEMFNSPNCFMPSDPETGTLGSTMGTSTWVAGGNYGREIQYTGRIHF